MMVVSFFSFTILSVSSMISSAVFGSSAAVCSSRIRKFDRCHGGHQKCHCLTLPAGQHEPTFTFSLSSSPRFKLAELFLIVIDLLLLFVPLLKSIESYPCYLQETYFPEWSSTDRFPLPDSDTHVRYCTVSLIFLFFGNILPINAESVHASAGILPQMILSIDVLPEPLLPTTETNSPSSIVRLKSSKQTHLIDCARIIIFMNMFKLKHPSSPSFCVPYQCTRIARNNTAVISFIACGSKNCGVRLPHMPYIPQNRSELLWLLLKMSAS